MLINYLEDIKHAFYINLEYRVDRKIHVETQMNSIGVTCNRFNAIKMNNGAIGCSMSHLKLLQEADKNNLEHILIVEDDITFLDPELFKTQINRFFELHENNWDVVLFAGNNTGLYQTIDDTCIKISRCQTTTGYLVNGHYIKVLIQNIKMGLFNLLNKPDLHNDFAIDKYWFILQSLNNWYLIIPLTVIQIDGYSDIEKCETKYEKLMTTLNKSIGFSSISKMLLPKNKY